MGILILGAMALYLAFSVAVVLAATRSARKNGGNVKLWGWGAALVMWLIPFWDWFPTVVTHQYYCATEAGFWVYKTPEQWRKENPGVMEGLVANMPWPHQTIDGNDVAIINQRMQVVYAPRHELFLHRWPDVRELWDAKSNEVLARYAGFSTAQERAGAGWYGWKFWLHSEDCIGGKDQAIQFVKFVEHFMGAKR